jgi:hypothetical protein
MGKSYRKKSNKTRKRRAGSMWTATQAKDCSKGQLDEKKVITSDECKKKKTNCNNYIYKHDGKYYYCRKDESNNKCKARGKTWRGRCKSIKRNGEIVDSGEYIAEKILKNMLAKLKSRDINDMTEEEGDKFIKELDLIAPQIADLEKKKTDKLLKETAFLYPSRSSRSSPSPIASSVRESEIADLLNELETFSNSQPGGNRRTLKKGGTMWTAMKSRNCNNARVLLDDGAKCKDKEDKIIDGIENCHNHIYKHEGKHYYCRKEGSNKKCKARGKTWRGRCSSVNPLFLEQQELISSIGRHNNNITRRRENVETNRGKIANLNSKIADHTRKALNHHRSNRESRALSEMRSKKLYETQKEKHHEDNQLQLESARISDTKRAAARTKLDNINSRLAAIDEASGRTSRR